MIYEPPSGARYPVKLVDYAHDADHPRDVVYASLTAPDVVRCEIAIDGKTADVVYAGAGSHSWWTGAGGKFLPPSLAPSGLAKGQRLSVVVSGPCALRIDWSPA